MASGGALSHECLRPSPIRLLWMDGPSPDRIDAHWMLAELDLPSSHRTILLREFGSALDELAHFIERAPQRPDVHSGHQVFAIYHLLARGLTDLIAAAHLLSHCYVVQAYSVMRPVLDACDLIELFVRDAKEASLWVTTTEGHKHFTPAQVRTRLGQERHDPIHGHFSESGSHPRFAGAQLSGGMRAALDDADDPVAILRIGPMFVEDAGALFAWLFAFNTLNKLAFKAQHLQVVASVTPRDWLTMYGRALAYLRNGAEAVGDELGKPEVIHMYDDGLAQLRAFRDSAG
jgi:hypothetical protein